MVPSTPAPCPFQSVKAAGRLDSITVLTPQHFRSPALLMLMYQLQKCFFSHTPSITHLQLALQTQGQQIPTLPQM